MRWLAAFAFAALALAGCTTGDDGPPGEPVASASTTDEGAPSGQKKPNLSDAEVTIESKDVAVTVRKIKAHVEKIGGRLIQEETDRAYSYESLWAKLRVKVPAVKARAFVEWVTANHVVRHQKLTFEEDDGRGGGPAADRMVIISLAIDEPWDEGGYHTHKAWVRIGARAVGAQINARGGSAAGGTPAPSQPAFRHGSGLSLMTPDNQAFSLNADIFARDTESQQPVLVTLGGSGYSTYLGSGKRAFLNPTLGMQVGYASFGDIASFALGGELGLELVKWHQCLLDGFGRGMILMNKNGSVLGKLYGVELMIPF